MTESKFDIDIPNERKWEVILEDWKMAKDRISIFDSQVIAIRISGIPLILVIIAVGLIIIDKLDQITIPYINCNGAIIPFAFAAFYTVPLCLLDALHYDLLLKAVNHAKNIEDSKPFKNLLRITNSLTSPRLTFIHTVSLYALYGIIFILCIILIKVFWNGVPLSMAHTIANNAASTELANGI